MTAHPPKPTFDEATVRKVASLARLELTTEEVARYASQLGEVLAYIQKLGELDTSQVEPMTHPFELETPLREDVAVPSPGHDVMLAPAPAQLHENYKVPQVL